METAKVYSLTPDASKLAMDYINKNSLTQTKFAELIGINRTTVNLYLLGKDVGSSKKLEIEGKIINFLKGEGFLSFDTDTETKAYQRPVLYKTQDAKGVLMVCQSSQEFMGLGVIIGRSGFGKTYTLKHFAKMPKVCYISASESWATKDMIKAIEHAIGLPTIGGTISDRADNIKEFFNVNKGYVLIVDEADKLISKYTQRKVEIIRDIFDNADVGIVLAGEPALEGLIKQYISRVANRVDFFYRMEGLSRQDVAEYIQPYTFTEEAFVEMYVRATNSQSGCFRLLDRTMKNIFRIVSEDTEITLKTIREASNMMML